MFQQKAAFEKRNQELKQWTDKQRDPAVEKMVCWTRFISLFTDTLARRCNTWLLILLITQKRFKLIL